MLQNEGCIATERALSARQAVNVNWIAKESAIMSKRKGKLTLLRVRFINIDLRVFFPHGTIDSIKGDRKSQERKNIIENVLKPSANQNHLLTRSSIHGQKKEDRIRCQVDLY